MTATDPYILVVDDFADGREMLTEYLTFRGLPVQEAADSATALRLARKRPPAVILMDLGMPGMDGWQATQALKADPRTSDIIVIAVTAHALDGDEAVARNAGCDGFIPKPYDITAVADAVSELFHQGRAALDRIAALAQETTSRAAGKDSALL